MKQDKLLFQKIAFKKGINKQVPSMGKKKPEERAEEAAEEDKDVDAGNEMSVTQKVLSYLKKKGAPLKE